MTKSVTNKTNYYIVRGRAAAAEAKLLGMPPYKSHLYITPNSVSTCGNCQPGSVAVGFVAGLCTGLYLKNNLFRYYVIHDQVDKGI